jgi:flavin-dependent thymidylate synthase
VNTPAEHCDLVAEHDPHTWEDADEGIMLCDGTAIGTLQKWADKAMYAAAPVDATAGPQVHLLWMTPDPLGAIAAACKMYKGAVVTDLESITDFERVEYLTQVQCTRLQAPFEFVQFHFLLEGVTRAFTHQLVRQRTATYAQESLRFAVKEDMPVALPPSLAGTVGDFDHFAAGSERAWAALPTAEKMRCMWDACVAQIRKTYSELVNMGMPAEDARGLTPHNILTRVHYTTDLRALLDHAGNRLCTQAQFEWRLVFARLVEAIRNYQDPTEPAGWHDNVGNDEWEAASNREADRARIAELFKPVCYATGRCEFKANFDRPCSIRSRVDANEKYGRPSAEWGETKVLGPPRFDRAPLPWAMSDGSGECIPAIKPEEWLADPGAAR